jgi:bifunctional DNA-binding transcriptional regulator/antitoxin component of YhaV-PrlF toxin-antitoxin module
MTDVVKVRQVGETLVITLTKAIRKEFDVREGDRVLLVAEGNTLTIRKISEEPPMSQESGVKDIDGHDLNRLIMEQGVRHSLVSIDSERIQQRVLANSWKMLQLAFDNFDHFLNEECNRLAHEKHHGK